MKLLMNCGLAGVVAVSGLAHAAEGVGPVVADAKQILVSGNGHKRDFPCNGRHLVVEGSDHVVTTTGTCASAEIGGANNTVSVEVAPKGKLVVGGTQQKVQWRSTGEPEQDLSGIDNKVQRVK